MAPSPGGAKALAVGGAVSVQAVFATYQLLLYGLGLTWRQASWAAIAAAVRRCWRRSESRKQR